MSGEMLIGVGEMFERRIASLPFTDEGIPSQEEAQLTKDIWNALTKEERKAILEHTAEMVAEDHRTTRDKIPDQTPYAMRLTHKYLKMKAK
ncbi:MAG: hypothetical protein V1875_02360 [Candidatus Altiarchaeota archaeon]